MIDELRRKQNEVVSELHRAIKLKNDTLELISEGRKILSDDKFSELINMLEFSLNKISELNEFSDKLSWDIRFLTLVKK